MEKRRVIKAKNEERRHAFYRIIPTDDEISWQMRHKLQLEKLL